MSIFEQPDIRSNTKGMMRKINLTLTGVLAVLAFVFTLGAGPIHARVMTLAMPACPIKATTVPPTKTPFTLPNENPHGDETFSVPGNPQGGETFSVHGTVQVTDQSGATISLTTYGAGADPTGVSWGRTVNTIQHATGSLTFDKGCTKTDPYGSNSCTWAWGESVTAAYQGALQEDVTSGKFIVDLTVIQTGPGFPDINTTKVGFTCRVCGATCTITIPDQLVQDQDQNTLGQSKVWDFMTFPLFLTTPLPIFRLLIGGFSNAQ